MYRMDAERIDTLGSGEVDYAHLRARLAANAARPAIININVGTTVKVRQPQCARRSSAVSSHGGDLRPLLLVLQPGCLCVP